MEGYELQVLKGLTKEIQNLSFEFTPETLENTIEGLEHLASIGNYYFNYTLGDKWQFIFNDWKNIVEMKNSLIQYKGNYKIMGDIYATLMRIKQ